METAPQNRRCASRLILIDSDGRVLLFRHKRNNGEEFWALPGGGLEQGETFEHAALREAKEELGITQLRLTLLWEEMTDFIYIDTPVRQQERFFFAEGDFSNVLRGVQEVHQHEHIVEAKWWSLREVKSCVELVFPEGLADQLEKRLGVGRQGFRGD